MLIDQAGSVEPWFLAIAVASSMIGTSLGKLLLESCDLAYLIAAFRIHGGVRHPFLCALEQRQCGVVIARLELTRAQTSVCLPNLLRCIVTNEFIVRPEFFLKVAVRRERIGHFICSRKRDYAGLQLVN